MARLDLPSHIVRGLFFALCCAGGVRRGSIRRHGHHGQRRSIFEHLGPRVRRNAARGPTSFGRIFDATVRSLRAGPICGREYSPIHSGRLASSRGLHLQSQTPSPRRGVDGASPSKAAPRVVEAPAPSVVEAPAPPVEEAVAEPAAVPAYAPIEPMSPTPAPPRFWCDFCKEFTPISYTLEYAYSLPSPTPASPTPVAARTGVPPLDPWFLNTQAAPALDAVEIEEEDAVVSGPGIGILINPGGTRAARTGVPPYYIAGPSVPPAAEAPASPPKMRAEAAARMKAQALPSPPPAEALPTSMLRRLLGRKTAAVDQRP